MLVPFNEILKFNTWASTQIVALANCPDEMTRLESVLYGIPVTARLTRADYITAVEHAHLTPDVPESVYNAFKNNQPQWSRLQSSSKVTEKHVDNQVSSGARIMQTAFDSIKDAEEFITQAVIVRGGNQHDVYRKVQSWHACGYSCVVWVLGNPVRVVLSKRAFPTVSIV